MEKVVRGHSPINTLFQYQIDSLSEITMDLSLFSDSNEHIKMVKNSIIYAILLHIRRDIGVRLKTINIQSDNKNRGLLVNKFLPLIVNQTRFFDLSISPSPSENRKFILRDEWIKQIVKNINFPVEPIKDKLSKLKISNSDKFLFYRTVSESQLQIRYKGYQIGKWNSKDGNIAPVNSLKDKPTFAEWASWLVEERSKVGGLKYDEKEEHYLESVLLEKLLNDHLEINDQQISKLFPNSSIFFQFPVLLKPGQSTAENSNSAKYIDILAKSGNRPVIMELKVWNKQRGVNSRGQYMFSAFSQILSYCNYLVNVFGNQKEGAHPELKELYDLNWDKPIIYVVINDIGEDDKAIEFRSFIKNIKAYIKNAELHFVEFEQVDWDQNREFNVKNII